MLDSEVNNDIFAAQWLTPLLSIMRRVRKGQGTGPRFVAVLKILILRVGIELIRRAVGKPVFVFKSRFTYHSRLESFLIFCTCGPLHDGICYACKAGQCARPNSFFMGFPEIVLLLRSWQLLKLSSGGHATQIWEYMPYLFIGVIGLDRCFFNIKKSFFFFFGQRLCYEIW